ncbi:UNVERIFIED_CONTAM: AAA domain-containing protein [Acetivibrio alkalicellulosi]
MIRIDRVRIENFQSHEDTSISFSDGLNVIVGSSDHGKSAIVRAIKWVLYNEPRGNDYIRQGANFARVTLDISNGYIITRERGPSKNRYILKNPEGNSSVFEGFGNEIPLEVVAAHGIPKVILDADKNSILNIGGQLEGPFLISETGSFRAKAIGKMTGLHILDKSIKDSVTDLRRENQTKERIGVEIKDVEDKLLEFKDIEVLKEKLDISVGIIARLEDYIKRIEALEKKRFELNEIYKKREQVKEALKSLDKLNECEINLKSIQLAQTRLSVAKGIQKRLFEVMQIIKDMNRVLYETEKVSEGISCIKVVYEKALKYEKIKNLNFSLKAILKDISIAQKVLENTDSAKEVEVMVKKIENSCMNVDKLSVSLERYLTCSKEIKTIEMQLNACNNVNETENIVNKIVKVGELSEKLNNLNKIFNSNVKSIQEGMSFLEKNKRDMEIMLSDYIEMLREKGTCPLCDSLIGDDMINNIKNYYNY